MATVRFRQVLERVVEVEVSDEQLAALRGSEWDSDKQEAVLFVTDLALEDAEDADLELKTQDGTWTNPETNEAEQLFEL